MAVGGKVNIQTLPGYLPLRQDKGLAQVFEANAISLVGADDLGRSAHRTGSTDMGDVSQLMPAIHPYVGGASGLGHGADYIVQDYHLVSCIRSSPHYSKVSEKIGNRILARTGETD